MLTESEAYATGQSEELFSNRIARVIRLTRNFRDMRL